MRIKIILIGTYSRQVLCFLIIFGQWNWCVWRGRLGRKNHIFAKAPCSTGPALLIKHINTINIVRKKKVSKRIVVTFIFLFAWVYLPPWSKMSETNTKLKFLAMQQKGTKQFNPLPEFWLQFLFILMMTGSDFPHYFLASSARLSNVLDLNGIRTHALYVYVLETQSVISPVCQSKKSMNVLQRLFINPCYSFDEFWLFIKKKCTYIF